MLTQIVADYFVRSFMYFLSLIGPQEISRTTIWLCKTIDDAIEKFT